MPTYRCAICQSAVEYAGVLPPRYPFCSERCRLVDLGKWFREQYTIDREQGAEDMGDIEGPAGEGAAWPVPPEPTDRN
jgi:hypothetical protein